MQKAMKTDAYVRDVRRKIEDGRYSRDERHKSLGGEIMAGK